MWLKKGRWGVGGLLPHLQQFSMQTVEPHASHGIHILTHVPEKRKYVKYKQATKMQTLVSVEPPTSHGIHLLTHVPDKNISPFYNVLHLRYKHANLNANISVCGKWYPPPQKYYIMLYIVPDDPVYLFPYTLQFFFCCSTNIWGNISKHRIVHQKKNKQLIF